KIPNLLEARILNNRSKSKGTDVKVLLKYADRVKAEMIIVNSHTRGGLSRLLMGSFAQQILYHSRRPLMFISPHTKEIRNMDKVLFATDMTAACKKSFQKFLNSLGDRVQSINLLHKL